MVRWGLPQHEILARWTDDELFELKVFDERFQPFGDEWRQAALIAAKIHNAWMKPVVKDEAELMPFTKPQIRPRRQTDAEMAAILIRKLVG